jgi:hypothetical protein
VHHVSKIDEAAAQTPKLYEKHMAYESRDYVVSKSGFKLPEI